MNELGYGWYVAGLSAGVALMMCDHSEWELAVGNAAVSVYLTWKLMSEKREKRKDGD